MNFLLGNKTMISFADAYRTPKHLKIGNIKIADTITTETQHKTQLTTILTGVTEHLSIALKCKMYDTYAIISQHNEHKKVILLEFIDYPILILDYQITPHCEHYTVDDITTTIDIAKPDSITQLIEIFKQVYNQAP